MSAPEQLGTACEVGIGDYTYAGYFVDSVGIKPTGEVKKIKDENKATATRIITDKGKAIKLAMIAKEGTDPTTLEIGDVITVNSVNYCVDDVDPQRMKGEEMKVTIDASKEDSMTYS